MKFLAITVSFIMITSYSAFGQKLYVERDFSIQLENDFSEINTFLLAAEKNLESQIKNEILDRKSLITNIRQIKLNCQNMVSRLDKVNTSIDKDSKYGAVLDAQNYYVFDEQKVSSLIELCNSLNSIDTKLKEQGYLFNFETEQSRQNFELLNDFQEGYDKFIKILQNAYSN